MSRRKTETADNGYPWINPVGGFGDMLMVSGVLKLAIEDDPARRFNLLRRTRYQHIFKGHPAIAEVGYPPKGAEINRVDYWALEKLGPGGQRPFQVLARAFGLETPVKEQLYLPGDPEEDPLLHDIIPWKEINVVIAPASDSPRKCMPPPVWHRLVDYLRGDDALVMQVGKMNERHIRNTYSLLGLTTPRQLIALLKKCDLLITSDNFLMHAAHMAGTPAVVVWGATDHEVYGYPGHEHIQGPATCDLDGEKVCIGSGPKKSDNIYGTQCPEGEGHCMNRISAEEVYEAAKKALLS